MAQNNLGRMALFCLNFHITIHREGRVGEGWTSLEAGADAEAMKECCLLACFPWLAQSAFLQNPGPPAQEGHHPQWAGPPPPITNLESAPQACLQPDVMEAFSQLRFLPLR